MRERQQETRVLIPALLFLQLGFYTACRVLFMLWNWRAFHAQNSSDFFYAFLHGLRFDLSAVGMLAAIPCLFALLTPFWQSKKIWNLGLLTAFVVLQLPTMVFNLGDTEFVNFTGRRLTADALFAFREGQDKFWQIAGSYIGLFFIFVFLLAAYAFGVYWIGRKSLQGKLQIKGDRKRLVALSLMIFGVMFVGIRGGFQKKPLGFAHAQIFAQPLMNNMVMNSAFTFLQTVKKDSLPRVKFFDERKEMLAALPGSWRSPSAMEGHRFKDPQNVVVIIVESLSLEYMGKPFADGQGYTPFLDSLAGRGIFFRNHYANAKRSIEGIGAILGGIPAWMNEPFLSSQYMSNYFLGVGALLSKYKYHSSFFHGGNNGTMYFDSFIKSIGIQHYFGANEYPNPTDFDGTWGIYDEPFLQWMAKNLGGFSQPFFSSVFTLSSHNPYKIPEKYQNVFPKGTMEIHESIGYADKSIENFFATASQQPWYANTLFIITADHTFKNSRPEFDNELSQYRIPLILFHPAWEKNPASKPVVNENQITSQIDILPTIFDFLGHEVPERNYLARSVFVPGDRWAMTFVDGKYHLVGDKAFLTYARDQQFRLYDLQDLGEKKELSEDSALKSSLETKMKAGMQYFSEGLWDNKLYYPVAR